jgi:hypothetical protein
MPIKQAGNGSEDALTSTTVLLPAWLRERVEVVARENERSVGAEVRLALKSWLTEDRPGA